MTSPSASGAKPRFVSSELRYREIFDSFSECIFVLDVTPDGRFRIAALNPAEEKATGLSNAEVAGRFIDEVLPKDTARRAIAHYQHCLEVGTLIHSLMRN